MVNISIGTAGIAAVLGYAVVFFGILLLMIVIVIAGKLLNGGVENKASQVAKSAPVPAQKATQPADLGELHAPKGTDPLEIAIMAAIAADMERGY